MNIAGGAIVTSPGETAICNEGGTGTLNVLVGGTLNANSYLTVGRGFGATNAADAVMNVLGGKVVTNGSNEFSTGSYGNTSNVGVTNIGYGSDGVTLGTVTSASEVWVGDDGGNGTMNVINGGTLTANNWLIVGRQGGVGVLNVSGNGLITKSSNNPFYVGFSYSTGGATGTVNQNGGSVISAATLTFAASSPDVGTYNLNGGVLAVPQVTQGSGNAIFNFNGGALRANSGASSNFVSGLTRANVRNGGAIIDTNGQNITVAQSLVHSNISGDLPVDGGFTKQGTGVLSLAASGSYTGSTTISGGTLRLGVAAATPVASYSFDNVSGTTVVNDGSGGSIMNGTLAGGASIVTGGRFGNAVSLSNGASVNINNPITDLSNTASWSVSAWVNTVTAGSSILSKGSGTSWTTGNTIFYLGNGTTSGGGGIPSSVRYAGGFFQGASTATAVNDGSWHLVTYVDSAGSYSIYVDGVSQGLSSGNSSFSNADVGSVVRLGVTTDSFAGDGTVNYNGKLDSVQFYNSALLPSQIVGLYQNSSTGTLPVTTHVNIVSGATLDLNSLSQSIGSLNGPSGAAITLGSGTLSFGTTENASFGGTISGTGSIAMTGSGTQTLGGNDTYYGRCYCKRRHSQSWTKQTHFGNFAA